MVDAAKVVGGCSKAWHMLKEMQKIGGGAAVAAPPPI